MRPHDLAPLPAQILLAVKAIHDAGIVHQDLKPANFVMVKGKLKLIDFGIADAFATSDATSVVRENQVGTINYMSPEALSMRMDGPHGVGPTVKVRRAHRCFRARARASVLTTGSPRPPVVDLGRHRSAARPTFGRWGASCTRWRTERRRSPICPSCTRSLRSRIPSTRSSIRPCRTSSF